jgi:hypothetical protein
MSTSKTRIDVQKRVRSACTTFQALRAEWEDVRGETRDAMTMMANARLECDNVDSLVLPDVLAGDDSGKALREALQRKRDEAFERAKLRMEEYREQVSEIRIDFDKLANTEKYFSSSIREYPDDGEILKTLTFKRFRDAFSRVAGTYARDIDAKEKILEKFIAGDDKITNSSTCDGFDDMELRDRYLALISAWVLDPLLDVDFVEEFNALVLRDELR